jgi:hypothetical protein
MLGCSSPGTSAAPEGSGAKGSAVARAPGSTTTTPTASASAAPTAAASATPTASASAAAAKTGVTSCEKSSGHFGGFTPSVDELVAAAKALESDVCIPRAVLEQAIRDCAKETGGTALRMFADELGGSKGCHLEVAGGGSKDRKWIVFSGFFRTGATFDGGSTAVELGATPSVYLDSLGAHNELCPMTSSPRKPPKELPSGWKTLPEDVKDFLCSGRRE